MVEDFTVMSHMSETMLELLRVTVTALMCLAFAVPLFIIAKNRDIREEPIVVLVINMLAAAVLFSCIFTGIAVGDSLSDNNIPPLLCTFLISLGASAVGGFKLIALFLAVEQFIAVTSMSHYAIMSRWVQRMVGLAWLFITVHTSFGISCHLLGLDTVVEFDRRMFGIDNHINNCRYETVTSLFHFSLEIFMFCFSFATCVLLIYTAVQGIKQERRISRGDASNHSRHFLVRFKSFKRIVKVLLTGVCLDIVATGFRIATRWYIDSSVLMIVHYFRVLFLITEFWTYGLSHVVVRNVLLSSFRGRKSQSLGEVQTREEPIRSQSNVLAVESGIYPG